MAEEYKPPTDLDPFDYAHQLIAEGKKVAAAEWCKEIAGQKKGQPMSEDSSWRYLNAFWHSLLDAELYAEAAAMNWGYDMFDGRPQLVKELLAFLPLHAKIIVLGASSVSKTYSIVAWLYLDYQRDPIHTAIKCVALNGEQLNRNIFTHLFKMHSKSVMKVSGTPGIRFLGEDTKNLDSGFEGILVPQGEEGSGRLKGVKPKPRGYKHPVFGKMSRARIVVDEFQATNPGMEKDFASPLASLSGPHQLKIILSGNPKFASHPFGKLSEPKGGWRTIDIEKDHRWQSKRQWEVLRLDGARSENVIQKKVIYPGLQTWEGFQEHLLKGENDSEYFTFGRGIFPVSGADDVCIPRVLAERSRADFMFHGGSTNCAAVDLGLRRDKARLAFGKYGMATGKRTFDGEEIMFVRSDKDISQAQFALQLVNTMEITGFNGDVVELAQEIAKLCATLNVDFSNLAVDSTGLGEGVYSYLKKYHGPVMPINWSEGASTIKIMYEDAKLPKDVYAGIPDEMWFATEKWLSFGAMSIGNRVRHEDLFAELCTRKIGSDRGGKRRVESKDEWKLRNSGKSPDEADSVVMLQQLVRARSGKLPTMGNAKLAMARPGDVKLPDASYIKALGFAPKTRPSDGAAKKDSFDLAKLRKTFIVNK